MKTSKDPRHKKRVKIVKNLFAQSFTKQQNLMPEAKEVIAKSKYLDDKIRAAAPLWPIEKLNRIDLAILRLAIYELNYKKTPPKVVIDEAVELAKTLGSENSASFVNGVLGTVYQQKGVNRK